MTTTTIGVAIAVPEPWGSKLQAYRASLGDPMASGIPTHITLMPPFEIAVDDLPRIEQHLLKASASANEFRIHLRGTGTFRPVSPVVFVTVVEGKPGVSNLLTIYSALTGRAISSIEEAYAGRGYGDLKKDLAEVTVDVVTPFRERTLELLEDRTYLDDVLRQGAAQAGAVARGTLRDVYERVGFVAAGQ